MGYGVPITRGIHCVGGIGIALNLSENEEKVFAAQGEKSIKKLLPKAAALISQRLS
ncbi:MAG: hypothetical protein J6K50_00890 [Clostridia bacterium]|nr:hypothetical protein [Clostridia bacterium]